MTQHPTVIIPQINTGTGGADKGGPKKPNVPKPDTKALLKRLERVPLKPKETA